MRRETKKWIPNKEKASEESADMAKIALNEAILDAPSFEGS